MTDPASRFQSCDSVTMNGGPLNCCSTCLLRLKLESLEDDGIHSDVVLKSGLTLFHVHKSFVAKRSPVFQRMVEGPETTIVVDLNPLCLHRLLYYIYIDVLEDKSIDAVAELLVAAKQFMMKDLKDICVAEMEDYVKTQRRYKRYQQVLATEKVPKTKVGEVIIAALVGCFN